MKYIIVENLEDHLYYKGQEVEIIKELENDYFEVTDGFHHWTVGAEEIEESKKMCEYMCNEVEENDD